MTACVSEDLRQDESLEMEGHASNATYSVGFRVLLVLV